jgi:hypothetical protein
MHSITRSAMPTLLLLALLLGCAPGEDDDDNPTEGPDEPIENNAVVLSAAEPEEQPSGIPTSELREVRVGTDDPNGVTIGTIELDGDFEVTDDNCTGRLVTPDQPCIVLVRVDATDAGVHPGSVSVTPEGGETSVVEFEATVEAQPSPSPTPEPTEETETPTPDPTGGAD